MAGRSLVMALDNNTQSSSQQASSEPVSSHANHVLLEELLDAGEQANALIDPSSDKITWCSEGWRSTFPDWAVGESWALILSRFQKLADLYRSLDDRVQVTETLTNPLSGELLDFQMYKLSDGLSLIHI